MKPVLAVDLGDGTVRLDNTPWFVRGIACGDVVAVEADEGVAKEWWDVEEGCVTAQWRAVSTG
ncbi:DUF4265 domain-containing protein [Streptomyces achromogenes]|uniref:DUF4265 domain-containing protein n=1 Tax=Streptomyces achromogenes TaxID=67255 RepID=UPI00056948C2|nr:DUF4265 domain-containing protein [Streptomyces achromogenes]